MNMCLLWYRLIYSFLEKKQKKKHQACHSIERGGNEEHVGAAVLEACQNNYKFVTLLCPTFF